jgi:hypothetical protein
MIFIATRAIFQLSGAVAITGDRAANLDVCLALSAFSSEGSSHQLRHGTSVFTITSIRPLDAALLAKEQSLPILHLRFDSAGKSGARTHDFPDAKRQRNH